MKRPKVTGLRRRESWQALPFLLPSLLGLCLFYLFPLAETVRASFMDPLRSRAVGWGNYRALFQNTAFRLAVRNTCRFLCICIPALLAVSLLCAVLLGAAKRRAVFFKSVLLLPYAIPVASIVVLWRALFSGKGLVNGLLVGLGCRPVDFMGSSAAFWVLIFTYLWRNNGYDMLLWLAGLETIPRPLYEAAAVDGATPFQTFVFITLPNLLPTVVLTTILSLVNSFKVFREAYLVAGNYPQESIRLAVGIAPQNNIAALVAGYPGRSAGRSGFQVAGVGLRIYGLVLGHDGVRQIGACFAQRNAFIAPGQHVVNGLHMRLSTAWYSWSLTCAAVSAVSFMVGPPRYQLSALVTTGATTCTSVAGLVSRAEMSSRTKA